MGKAGGGKGRPDLLRARLERGMTQEEAAAAVGVAVGTWGRWERSEQGIRPHSRRKIAAVFEAESAEVEQWIEGWALGETSSWPVAEYGDTSTAASVKSAALLWRYEMDESRRHLLATLPFVPSVLAGWITAWNYSDRLRRSRSEETGARWARPTSTGSTRRARFSVTWTTSSGPVWSARRWFGTWTPR